MKNLILSLAIVSFLSASTVFAEGTPAIELHPDDEGCNILVKDENGNDELIMVNGGKCEEVKQNIGNFVDGAKPDDCKIVEE